MQINKKDLQQQSTSDFSIDFLNVQAGFCNSGLYAILLAYYQLIYM